MKRIIVDEENVAEEWWSAAQDDPNVPNAALALTAFAGDSEIIVTDDEAAQILAWARNLPGWYGGPEHAPHPLIVEDA